MSQQGRGELRDHIWPCGSLGVAAGWRLSRLPLGASWPGPFTRRPYLLTQRLTHMLSNLWGLAVHPLAEMVLPAAPGTDDPLQQASQTAPLLLTYHPRGCRHFHCLTIFRISLVWMKVFAYLNNRAGNSKHTLHLLHIFKTMKYVTVIMAIPLNQWTLVYFLLIYILQVDNNLEMVRQEDNQQGFSFL